MPPTDWSHWREVWRRARGLLLPLAAGSLHAVGSMLVTELERARRNQSLDGISSTRSDGIRLQYLGKASRANFLFTYSSSCFLLAEMVTAETECDFRPFPFPRV